jgi:hypothetical protein
MDSAEQNDIQILSVNSAVKLVDRRTDKELDDLCEKLREVSWYCVQHVGKLQL